MKKLYLIILISLLFFSCRINGYKAEDCTHLDGNGYYNNTLIRNLIVYREDFQTIPDNVKKPYMTLRWIDNEGLSLNTVCDCGDETWESSFEMICFVHFNKKEKMIGKELLNNSVLTFTYYPKDGEPITVDSSGVTWDGDEEDRNACFTVDFDNKEFTAGKLL